MDRVPLKLRKAAMMRRLDTTMATPMTAMIAACVSDSKVARELSSTTTSPAPPSAPRPPINLAGMSADDRFIKANLRSRN